MFEFYSVPLYSGSFHKVIDTISKWIHQKTKSYVCVVSVHGIVEAYHDKKFLRILQHARLAVPDGMPLVHVGKLFGQSGTTRIYGPDLFLGICEEAEKKQFRVFFYGTTVKTLEKMKKHIQQIYPHLMIVGLHAPPFRPLLSYEISRERDYIRSRKPQIIFVGLSTPKQELWMAKNYSSFSGCTCIGVGAAFDFIAATKKQAPYWMRRTGLEWMFRFSQEPKRLWKRYVFCMLLFPYFLLVSLLRFWKKTS